MFFSSLTFLSAFLIEGIGTYVSILGLSALFAFNPVIIAMAIALDVGKLISVSFLYKHWHAVNSLMKMYMTAAAAVLIIITSVGVFGFLSGEFQKAISNNDQQVTIISALEEERDRLLARKRQIDDQVAALPERFTANQRIRIIAQFRKEQREVTARITEIDRRLPELKVANIEKQVKIGPIIYVADAFGTTPERAAKWVILIIIFVFDPLAIALVLAGNFLWEHRGPRREATPRDDAEPEPPVELIADDAPVTEMPKAAPVVKCREEPASAENLPPAEQAETTEKKSPEGSQASLVKKAPSAAGPAERPSATITRGKPRARLAKSSTADTSGVREASEELPPSQALASVDVRRRDITADDDYQHRRVISSIIEKYQGDDPAVLVGGPPTKL